MFGFIAKVFVWWKDATPGTLLTLATRKNVKVGEDEFGNQYFAENGKTGPNEKQRRWVVYNGYADASRIPTDWHGWMHHTFERPPTEEPLARKSFEKDHHPNLSGTIHAYHPSGSLAESHNRQASTGDYEAWAPEKS